MGRPLEIDATMLFEALTRPLEWEAHLDLNSGEVLLGSAWDADEDETDADRESLVEIPRLESRAEYDLMARFAEGVTGPGAPPARASKPRVPRIGLVDVLLLGAPDGKTELLEGEVLRVFQAASPSEARAVFKAVARDLCELHGTPWRNRLVEGRETFTLERARLRVDATRVELAVEVSPALWRRFSGG